MGTAHEVAVERPGSRYLAQATLITLASLLGVFMVGAGVDALHAASMVILAAVDRTARRAAPADAGRSL